MKITVALQQAIKDALEDPRLEDFYRPAEAVSLRARARDFLETKPGFDLSKSQEQLFKVFLEQLKPDAIPAHAAVIELAATD